MADAPVDLLDDMSDDELERRTAAAGGDDDAEVVDDAVSITSVGAPTQRATPAAAAAAAVSRPVSLLAQSPWGAAAHAYAPPPPLKRKRDTAKPAPAAASASANPDSSPPAPTPKRAKGKAGVSAKAALHAAAESSTATASAKKDGTEESERANKESKTEKYGPDYWNWVGHDGVQAYTWLVMFPQHNGSSGQKFKKISEDLRRQFGLNLTSAAISDTYQNRTRHDKPAANIRRTSTAYMVSRYGATWNDPSRELEVLSHLHKVITAECQPEYDPSNPRIQHLTWKRENAKLKHERIQILLELESRACEIGPTGNQQYLSFLRQTAAELGHVLQCGSAPTQRRAAAAGPSSATVIAPYATVSSSGASSSASGFNLQFGNNLQEKASDSATTAKPVAADGQAPVPGPAAAAAAVAPAPVASPAAAAAAQKPAPAAASASSTMTAGTAAALLARAAAATTPTSRPHVPGSLGLAKGGRKLKTQATGKGKGKGKRSAAAAAATEEDAVAEEPVVVSDAAAAAVVTAAADAAQNQQA